MKVRSRLSLVLIFLLPTVLFAAEGRIPISEPTATPINQPGSYFLSNDISASCDAIQIAVSDVTIDLDGHTIHAGSAMNCSGIETTDAVTNIHVLNGRISGGYTGIWLNGAVSGGGDFSVRNITITGVVNTGINIHGDGSECNENRARAVIEDCTAKAANDVTAAAGIYLVCVEGSRIERNQMRNINVGISLTNSSNTIIENNSVTSNNSNGIEILTSDRNQRQHGHRQPGGGHLPGPFAGQHGRTEQCFQERHCQQAQ